MISPNLPRALVVGSTGLIGSCLLPPLMASGAYADVHAVQRRPGHVQGVVTHVHDFETLPELELGFRFRDAFCCLGTTLHAAGSRDAFRRVDYDYVRDFALLARRHGVSHFLLVSAVGATPRTSNFYLRTKGEAEDAVRDVGFERVSIFRPSLLLGTRNEKRTAERVAQRCAPVYGPLLVGPLRRYRAVDASVVAQAMLACATHETTTPTAAHQVIEYDQLTRLAGVA